MVLCKTVVANLSSYLDDEISPEMRRAIERHLSYCRKCRVVYDSTRKLLIFVGDDRTFEVPAGYSSRLHDFLRDSGIPAERP